MDRHQIYIYTYYIFGKKKKEEILLYDLKKEKKNIPLLNFRKEKKKIPWKNLISLISLSLDLFLSKTNGVNLSWDSKVLAFVSWKSSHQEELALTIILYSLFSHIGLTKTCRKYNLKVSCRCKNRSTILNLGVGFTIKNLFTICLSISFLNTFLLTFLYLILHDNTRNTKDGTTYCVV